MEVFITSPWVPAEWIKAHGFEPRGVWSAANRPRVAVAEGVCAFAQAMAALAEARSHAAVIFTTACDQMRRAADAVCTAQGSTGDPPVPAGDPPDGTGEPVRPSIDGLFAHSHTPIPVGGSPAGAGGSPALPVLGAHPRTASRLFLFNLPATWQTPAARQLYHAEVERLGRFLERLGGQSPTTDQLAAVIRDYDERRARLREFILRASAKEVAKALAQFLGDGSSPGNESPHEPGGGARLSQRAVPPNSEHGALGQTRPASCRQASRHPARTGVPLALVGGPLLAPQWPLFDAIESVGGRVVLNATEPGERCVLPPLPSLAPGQSPLTLLADHYFDHCVDVFHRPNSRLYAWLGARLAGRRVRGIVLWVHMGCDLWRAEAASFREAFGLPVLVLEAHEPGESRLREMNRLAAFLESLQAPSRQRVTQTLIQVQQKVA